MRSKKDFKKFCIKVEFTDAQLETLVEACDSMSGDDFFKYCRTVIGGICGYDLKVHVHELRSYKRQERLTLK